jgi:cytochrome P450
MTAHLPSLAMRQKPVRVDRDFPSIGKAELSSIPGRKGLPFLGILPEAVRDPFSFSRRMYDQYGPVHRFYACGNWNVQLVGPEANEFVLFDRPGNFSAYGGWKPVFGRHFDGGLLLRDGEDHQWHRKLLATAFKQDQLQSYVSVFSKNIADLCPRSPDELEAYEFAQRLTFANGYAAFLGRDATLATRSDLLAFRYMMRSATAVLPWALPGTAHARANWAKRHIADLLQPVFEDVPGEERTDLAAVLVRMHRDGLLSKQEVLAHLTFTIAASFDALSSGTVSSLYYLARHPQWQQQVREELCGRIKSADAVGLIELQSCLVSDWAVKEALRLNAAAPVLWRRAVRDVEFAGYSLPAGTITGVNPMLTHLLPEIWDEPTRFDPGRFAPELTSQRHRFSYVPFGGGAHGCLGANFASLQVRALLRRLLERFELSLKDTAPPRWYHWPNCRPLGGLRLTLRSL